MTRPLDSSVQFARDIVELLDLQWLCGFDCPCTTTDTETVWQIGDPTTGLPTATPWTPK